MFALDFLRVLLAHLMLLSSQMPLVSPPAVGVKLGDAKRGQQLLELQEDVVLPSSEHICQDLARVVINGVPQPTRIRFFAHITPRFVEFGAEPTTHLKLICAPDFHFHVRGMQGCQHAMIHRLQLRLFFFSSLMTVVGLTCKTRAVSRIPLAFMAMSTICCFTSGDWPA